MGKVKITKDYLETVSTEELFKLADENNLYFPPGLNRTLAIGELLEFIEEEQKGAIPTPLVEVDIEDKQRLLPQTYNTTEIHVVARDPLWLFCFWDFHEYLLQTLIESRKFEGFFLRVHSLDPLEDYISLDSFDIDILPHDRKRYIHLSFDDCANRVDLCAKNNDGLDQVISQSNIVVLSRKTIPRQLCIAHNSTDRILALSGLSAIKKSYFKHYRQAFR